MPKTLSTIVLAVLLSGPAPAAAQTYKWHDEFGRVNYGDTPPGSAIDAEAVGVPECLTEACLKDEERRFEEAQERNRELQDWIDKRADERVEQAKIEAQRAEAEARRAEALLRSAPSAVIVPVPTWWPRSRPWHGWSDIERPIPTPLPEIPPVVRPGATLPVQ